MTPKKKHEAVASITLAELSERYLQHLEAEGRSRGTVFSYSMELNVAQRELNADRSIGAISRADIENYNASDRVMKLKNGKPKAAPSYLKTQRVLRLALAWAAQTGLIATSPAEPIEAPAPTTEKRAKKSKDAPLPHTADVTVVVGDEQITDGSPAPKKAKRSRKQAIVLEVAQADAERAADEAEANLAATNPESAA
jgi:hypothetical protein